MSEAKLWCITGDYHEVDKNGSVNTWAHTFRCHVVGISIDDAITTARERLEATPNRTRVVIWSATHQARDAWLSKIVQGLIAEGGMTDV